jgi:hypothetical protein
MRRGVARGGGNRLIEGLGDLRNRDGIGFANHTRPDDAIRSDI